MEKKKKQICAIQIFVKKKKKKIQIRKSDMDHMWGTSACSVNEALFTQIPNGAASKPDRAAQQESSQNRAHKRNSRTYTLTCVADDCSLSYTRSLAKLKNSLI